MIPTLIFSKDRACQLDLLLRSIERNAPLLSPVKVLWTASDQLYRDGYDQCRAEHPAILWHEEDHFRVHVLFWVAASTALACLLVDDDIVYRPMGAAAAVALEDPDVLAFCPRLGANTIRCYPLDQEQSTPDYFATRDVYVTWDWRTAAYDYHYPGSLDGNVFRTADIIPPLANTGFSNPNEMEDALAQWFARNMGTSRPLLASYYESAIVNNPANIVNVTHPNRRAVSRLQPQYELNRRYLAGERIDLDALNFRGIDAAHYEIQYVLR